MLQLRCYGNAYRNWGNCDMGQQWKTDSPKHQSSCQIQVDTVHCPETMFGLGIKHDLGEAGIRIVSEIVRERESTTEGTDNNSWKET